MNIDTKKYAFILGTNPALSIAEILAVGKKLKNFRVISFSNEILFTECEQISASLIDHMGGTIKIVEIFHEFFKKEYNSDNTIDIIAKQISDNFDTNNKIHFGLSFYCLDSLAETMRISRSLKYICINLKKELRDQNTRIAFINSSERNLSSASVIQNELVTQNGMEAVIIIAKKEVFIAKTICVQNINMYTKLDFGRPIRDVVSGTTPPKLAKIMINLAEKNLDSKLADVFCGSGTFLQEMLLMGYKNVIGSDDSQKAVDDTKNNLEWLKDNFPKVGSNYDIYKSDARDIYNFIKPDSIDAFISEVYLGPPAKGFIDESNLNHLISELNDLYTFVLKKLYPLLKNGGVIVLALPIYKTRRGIKSLPIIDNIKEIGFELKSISGMFDNTYSKYFTDHGSIIYSRPDQIVLREIVVLKK